MTLKNLLAKRSKEELITEIMMLAKKFPMVKEYYDSQSGKTEEILEKYKKMIQQEYFPTRGFGRARASIIRKAISDFKKISKSEDDVIELLLIHVEQGIAFTREYGDIDEAFYSSIESSFHSALKLIAQHNLFQKYQSDCFDMVEKGSGFGWGFSDYLEQAYYNTFPDDLEEE